MGVEVFQPEDLLSLEVQSAQLQDLPRDKLLEYGWQFAEGGSAFTVWSEVNGLKQPIFCGGSLRRSADYASLWALFSVHRPAVPMFLTRATKLYIDGLTQRRVDAQVASSNSAACGWARLVGLEEETRLLRAMPDGSDMVIYVKKGLI